MKVADLIGISYSPWTEKARWALDHHRVPYQYHEHMILVGMPELRMRTGRWFGELTVPALRDGKSVFTDSWDIARHADLAAATGSHESLFPIEFAHEIEQFNLMSEAALGAVRAMIVFRLKKSREAKLEALNGLVPGPLRSSFIWLADLGISYIRRSFEIPGNQGAEREAEFEARLEAVLRELRAALRSGGGEYLVGGRFTYADVAMSQVLQGVRPVARPWFKFQPHTRQLWSTPRLESEFADLLEWRDRLYDMHRPDAPRRSH